MKNNIIICLLLVLVACSKEKKQVSNRDSNNDIETRVSQLMSKMSLDEKLGQLNLRGTSSRVKGELPEELKEAVRQGKIGAFLNVMNKDYVRELQKIATEESPNKIPLIFSRDVIHGFKTIFPIPLGIAATWDQEVARQGARVSAIEASSYGVRWTFAPMLDISRDSRWGRIAESPGEDPYLASILAKGYIRGFQGDSLNNPTSLAACAKHFLAYGAAIGGRDYNTANMSETLLRNVYLPPFKAAIDEGAQTVMTSFNEINGVPASGNEFILEDVLRDELNFNGFVVSDWDSVKEMIFHGFAKDLKHAGELAVNASLDMEMTSKAYELHLKELINEGKVTLEQIDFLASNILRVKFKLGLFETPFVPDNHSGNFYAKTHLKQAKAAAIKSSVLLKNESVLPIKKGKSVAVIGPLADQPHEQLGTWTFDGDKTHTLTPLKAFNDSNVNVNFSSGLKYSRDKSQKGFASAIKAASKSDVVVLFCGEEAILSGEAHSRAEIDLPGAQEALIKAVAKTGKPIVLVIMAGRPITITNIIDDVDAVLMAWHPGTMGGAALYDILFGIAEPGGRLPVTWPKTSGQLPLFYNHKTTGRPANEEKYVQMDSIKIGAWQSSLGNQSHYLDVGYTPHFPFGFGLGYTKFEYSNLRLSHTEMNETGTITASIEIKNTGERDGTDIIQLYIQDVVGSITRPVKELKGFKTIKLKKGETQEVVFEISVNDLKFVNNKMNYVTEPGKFNVYIGPNSAEVLKTSFEYK